MFGIVLVTIDTEKGARDLARHLVAAKLAACVNIRPIYSIYRWRGEIEEENEWKLEIKTDLANFAALENEIGKLHPYEVPEIIALPIVKGSESYLNWLGENTDDRG